jgi:hypothetical protein
VPLNFRLPLVGMVFILTLDSEFPSVSLKPKSLTEKVFSPLANFQPFFFVAFQGSLKLLKELGFRTFHPYINESYDDEPNDKIRLEMAWEQIQRLHKTEPREVYAHFRDVLEHNHQLMLGWTDQQLQDISQFLQKRLAEVCSRANYKNVHGLFPK